MPRLLICLPLLLVLPSCYYAGAQPQHPDEAKPEPPPSLPSGPPGPAEMERLARTDPVRFLEECLHHHDARTRGYRLVMHKRERIGNTLHPPELVDVCFREKPFSVLLCWREGARLAERTLYVEGENDGQMLARPAGWRRHLAGSIVTRDPDSSSARQSGRYPVTQYGLKNALLRALRSWRAAREEGRLRMEHLGDGTRPEVGNRPCLVLRQTYPDPPEGPDRVRRVTAYYDRETWIQAGSVLEADDGQLVAEYFFRDVQFNPEFPPGQFTRAALTP